MIENIKNLSYSKHQTVKSNLYNCLGDRPDAPFPSLTIKIKKFIVIKVSVMKIKKVVKFTITNIRVRK